jgi:hypothetical protein
MKNKKLWLILLLFTSINLFGQQKTEVLNIFTPYQPFYDLSSSVSTGVFFPFGYYETMLKPAPFINLSTTYNPKLVDYFLLGFEIEYSFSTLQHKTDSTYSFLPLGPFIEYAYPVSETIFVTPHLGAGFYFMTIDNDNYRNYYTNALLKVEYSPSSNLKLNIHGGYQYYNDQNFPLEGIKVGGGFTWIWGDPPIEKDVKLISHDLKKVFAPLYPYYYKNRLGMIKIQNTAEMDLREISVSFYIEDFMEEKTPSKFVRPILKSEQEAIFPVYAFFSKSMRNIKNDTNTTGIIEIRFTKPNGKHYIKKFPVPITIHNINSLTWDDLNKIGSFVSVKDKSIISFTRAALSHPIADIPLSLPEDMVNAVRIIEALRTYGLKYIKDPNTFFEQTLNPVDYIQYPQETLVTKTGDCDDLSVLTASLLESVGIQTAFVTTPSHIFIMLHIDNELIPKKTVKFQGKKWIPLDPTAIDKGFVRAWDVAYEFFQRKETEKIVSSMEATSRFSPILFNHKEIEVSLNEDYGKFVVDTINALFPKDLDKKELPAVAINQMGIQAAQQKDYLTAELYFNQAAEKGLKSGYYNLMVLYNRTKNFEKAKELYQKYVNHFALDKKMTELIAKTYYHMELERRKKLKIALNTKADKGIFTSKLFFVNKLFYNSWIFEELEKLKDEMDGKEPEFNWFE